LPTNGLGNCTRPDNHTAGGIVTQKMELATELIKKAGKQEKPFLISSFPYSNLPLRTDISSPWLFARRVTTILICRLLNRHRAFKAFTVERHW
jgi:hypothetical protein